MSVGAAFLCQSAGRVWFEVEELEALGQFRVGFAGTIFRDKEVGEDAASWAVSTYGGTCHGSLSNYPSAPCINPSTAAAAPSCILIRSVAQNMASDNMPLLR
jgi:hypothetical protein